MALSFDGTSADIDCSIGNCPKNLANISWAAIVRTGSSVAASRTIGSVSDGTANEWAITISASAHLQFWNGSGVSNSASTLVANTWYFLGASKATGTQAGRFRLYDYATHTFTHDTSVETLTDGTAAASPTLYIGSYRGSAEFWNGDMVVQAVWNRVLTDAEFENLPYSLSYWNASNPSVGHLYDQAATTTKINDWTGGGSKESARTGTTVSANAVPVFSYGASMPWSHAPAAAVGAGPKLQVVTSNLRW